MKTYLDCIPCMMNQALRVGRELQLEDGQIKHLMDDVGRLVADMSLDSTPPELATRVHERLSSITGEIDPYAKAKAEHIREALELLPEMRRVVAQADDPLMAAIRLAIVGNVIDLGMEHHIDLPREIRHSQSRELAVSDYEEFKDRLAAADWVLYLGDNSGESVFDRVLIEQLGKPVKFVVRDTPIINDVTAADASASGLDEVAQVISSGVPSPGTVLRLCTPEFLTLFNKAPMIISKGQGNYEGLSDTDRPVFFLLKIKCKVLARDVSVEEGSLVLKEAADSRARRLGMATAG